MFKNKRVKCLEDALMYSEQELDLLRREFDQYKAEQAAFERFRARRRRTFLVTTSDGRKVPLLGVWVGYRDYKTGLLVEIRDANKSHYFWNPIMVEDRTTFEEDCDD